MSDDVDKAWEQEIRDQQDADHALKIKYFYKPNDVSKQNWLRFEIPRNIPNQEPEQRANRLEAGAAQFGSKDASTPVQQSKSARFQFFDSEADTQIGDGTELCRTDNQLNGPNRGGQVGLEAQNDQKDCGSEPCRQENGGGPSDETRGNPGKISLFEPTEIESARTKLKAKLRPADRRVYRLASGLYKLDFSGLRIIPKGKHELSPADWKRLDEELAMTRRRTPRKAKSWRANDYRAYEHNEQVSHVLGQLDYNMNSAKDYQFVTKHTDGGTLRPVPIDNQAADGPNADVSPNGGSSDGSQEDDQENIKFPPVKPMATRPKESERQMDPVPLCHFAHITASPKNVNEAAAEPLSDVDFARLMLRTVLTRGDRRKWRIASGLYQCDARGNVRPKSGYLLTVDERKLLQEEIGRTRKTSTASCDGVSF